VFGYFPFFGIFDPISSLKVLSEKIIFKNIIRLVNQSAALMVI